MEDLTTEARSALRGAVLGTPMTIDDVVDQLRAIEVAARTLLPQGERSGIACFTRLYRDVTIAVCEGAQGDRFRTDDFILRLDVAFARRYLAALRAHLQPTTTKTTPACWTMLFDGRTDDAPEWHSAALGVTAHVVFDLVFALLDVWERDDPGADLDAQRRDYDEINEIFAENMDRLRENAGAPAADEDHDGRWPDRWSNLASGALVTWTRGQAWDQAVKLWNVRAPWYRQRQESDLDERACFYSGVILTIRHPDWLP